MSRFVVDLGKLKLSNTQKDAIASAIQTAVLAQLASHSPALGEGTVGAAVSGNGNFGLIPIGWRGLIFRPTLGELEQGEKQIAGFANQ